MGLLKDMLSGMGNDKKEFKSKFKEAEQNRKIQKLIEEREKSANQRELERRMKIQQEDEYKEILDKLRKKDNKDMWCSNSLLKSQTSIMKNDRPILKEKNIFKGNKNMFMNKGGVFMK